VTLKATPKARRLLATILSVLAGVMVVGAVGLLGYPTYTDIRASRQQKALRMEFANSTNLKQAYQNAAHPGPAGSTTKVVLAEGSAVTRIQIPKLHVDTVVVQGTSMQALAAGAGHYPQTPLPCASSGNVGIAGHRTMNGHPFQHIDSLSPGDRIILTTPFQQCTYQVIPAVDGHPNPYVTDPNDWTVIAQTAQPMLTMSTCTPEGTARQRLVARASLVSVTNTAPGSSLK
jgi:sortase A